MEFHPLCAMFPNLPGKEFQDLVHSIKTFGQREPIIVDQNGALVDGRHRFRACQAAGIEPKIKTVKFSDDTEISALIYNSNIVRRHLTPGARARLAAKIYPKPLKRGHQSKGLANARPETLPSLNELAKRLTVPKSLISKARKVYRSDDKKLIKKMDSDEVSIEEAYLEIKKQEAAEAKEDPPISRTALDRGKVDTEPLRDAIGRLEGLGREIKALLLEPQYVNVIRQSVDADLINLIRHLKAGLPHALCPYCGGDQCDACKGQGWITRIGYESAPRELK